MLTDDEKYSWMGDYPIDGKPVSNLPDGYVLVVYWETDRHMSVHQKEQHTFAHVGDYYGSSHDRLLPLIKLMGTRQDENSAPTIHFDSYESYQEFINGPEPDTDAAASAAS